ncbi:hypothetical protein DSECCO2_617860 [anaerobic digester metagenome]
MQEYKAGYLKLQMMHFAIMSNVIGNGLELQIENFIKEYPGTGLIVIDTLQKVRKTVSANVNPYAADYDDINTLKQIADKYKLAIVLVHISVKLVTVIR